MVCRRRKSQDRGGRHRVGNLRAAASLFAFSGKGVERCPGHNTTGAGRRGGDRTPAQLRLLLRSDQSIHVLVGDDRRLVPVLLVLRRRSKSGAAVSHGTVTRRGQAFAARECVLEDSAADRRAAGRCARFRFLRLQSAPATLQRGRARAAEHRRGGSSICVTAGGVRHRVRESAARGRALGGA